MMKLAALFVAVLLAASVTIPNVFSDDESQQGSSDKKESNSLDFSQSSSSTTNIGEQISDYIHKRNDILKQERSQTLSIIKSCKEQLKNASQDQRKQIMEQCKVELKTIKEKYKDMLVQLQQQFKQFRQGILDKNKILTEKQSQDFFNHISNHVSEKTQKDSWHKKENSNKNKGHSD